MADLSPTGQQGRYTVTAAAAVPVGECRQLANGLPAGYTGSFAQADWKNH